MAQEKKERIFISYKRVDKERVFAIKDGIEQATGEKCWIDLDGIESNAQFVAKIVGAIDECEIFLFMRSKEHNNITNLETDWTIREVNYALEEHKNIVIVNLDNTPMPKWFKFMFPNKQEIDATDPEKIDRLYKDLCEWLGVSPRNIPQSAKEEIPTNHTPPQPTIVQTPADIEQAKRNALPKGEFQVGDLMYEASEKGSGVTVFGPVNGDAVEIHIPSQIKYGKYTYEVTSIGEHAFNCCKALTSITIPNSVTNIGECAFYMCTDLTSITIPNSVTSIGEGAFYMCSGLKSITIPNSVTSIGSEAFFCCSSLKSITIPNSVTSIGSKAFQSCSCLTSITISNSVTSIGESVFDSCSYLTSIIVEKGNNTYDSRENCNAIIETATNTLIQGCNSTIIPNSVTSIGKRAFYWCERLTSITIPNSVTSIGESAFDNCSYLTSIIVEKGNNTYDSRENCNAIIETATNTLIQGCNSTIIPNSVTSIGESAFESCVYLTSITIPNSVTSIGKGAFLRCDSLKSIRLPRSVTDIGENAFPDHTKVRRGLF